jgi:hypothetical protein
MNDAEKRLWNQVGERTKTLEALVGINLRHLHEGLLHKRGGQTGFFSGGWRRRYCVIVRSFLFYFRVVSQGVCARAMCASRQSFTRKMALVQNYDTEIPRGCIFLPDAEIEYVDTSRHIIRIVPTVPRRPGYDLDMSRTFQLRAANEEQATEWLTALRNVARQMTR